MLRWGIGGDVTENGIAAELAANLGQDDERVGLYFALAVFADVVLYVGLEVIGMIGITEVLAATGLQVVDPRQPVAVDELGIKAKSVRGRCKAAARTSFPRPRAA